MRDGRVLSLSDHDQAQWEYALQIGFIRQQRSWTTLDISCEVFEEYIRSNQISDSIWRVAFSFGIKSTENEFEHPPLKSSYRCSTTMEDAPAEYGSFIARRSLL